MTDNSERSQTPPTSNERDQLITALYLLKGQAQSPIHCETAGRAIHEIERLSRERDDAIAERIQETKEANRLRDAVTAGSARREVLRAVLGRFMDASCDGNLKVWAQEQLSGEPTSAPETFERIDEGKLWSFLRDVMTTGCAIETDTRSLGRRYEEHSARLDAAARDAVPQFFKRLGLKASPELAPVYQRKCARCGKMAASATPEGVGVYYCSIECAD